MPVSRSRSRKISFAFDRHRKPPHESSTDSLPLPLELSAPENHRSRPPSRAVDQDEGILLPPNETSEHHKNHQGKTATMESNENNGQTTAVASKRYEDDTQYPVHKILNHRLRAHDDAVELLVQWGGQWLDDDPTWELEDDLWETCRGKVLEYWAPNGKNKRTSLLGLDPVEGPFTIARILDEASRRKKGTSTTTYYLVSFVGYAKPGWHPSSCVPDEWIEEWEKEKQEQE